MASEKKYSSFIRPMLATLHDAPFSDPRWLFEIKWDGYRAIAETNGVQSRLYSRNGLAFEKSYPAVFEALKKIRRKMVLDGEIVATDEQGKPVFQLLQNALEGEVRLHYYVFDILYLNGKSLEGKPLIERKAMLEKLLPQSDVIRYSDHVLERGDEFFKVMQERGLEGMIAKRADSTYREGVRSPDWRKVKHIQTDEAVIVGFTQARGSRKHFGAVVLGQYVKGKLVYIGHTGTGFNTGTLKTLYERMKRMETGESPFEGRIKTNMPVTWIRPELVCNIKYTEVTKDGIRRHPVFMGLRTDKEAEEVTENNDSLPESHKATTMKEQQTVEGHQLKFSNLDKVFWPDEGYTKGDVIEYYNSVYRYIIKYLRDRPLSLKRNPNGILDNGFFHKDAGDDAPEWMDVERVWSDSSRRHIDYIVCNNKATLLYLANLGCIEMNPWHSRVGQLETPDYIILDIDPSEKNTFAQVIDTAKAIKEVLDKAGAPGFLKSSGSRGLHIYVPLKARYSYEQGVAFAELIAAHAHELVPDFTSLERSLKKRGDNIYIDYLQNRIAQTIAAPYSLRPRPHAPVSAPLHWEELKSSLTVDRFHIRNAMQRIKKEGDIFSGVLTKAADITKCLKKLGG